MFRPHTIKVPVLPGFFSLLVFAGLVQAKTPSPSPSAPPQTPHSLIQSLGFSDPWSLAIAAYVFVAVLTLMPILWPLVFPPRPDERAADFQNIGHIRQYQDWLVQHFSEVYPLLREWKKRAKALAYYRVYYTWWTLLSSVSLPLLIQSAGTEPQSKLFFTVVSAHTAILIASNKVFRVLDKIRLYRKGLYLYNAVYRQLKFRPDELGDNEAQQVNNYTQRVERIIAWVRAMDTPPPETDEEARDFSTRKH